MTPEKLIQYMNKWRKEHHNIYKSAEIFWQQFFKELRKQAEDLCYNCYENWKNDEWGPYDDEDFWLDGFDDLVYRKNKQVWTIFFRF